MGKAFGPVLRSLIKREFGTAERYAKAAGLTAGRVSQLVGGRELGISYRTLQLLLGPFKDSRDQERLYRAWIDTYARSPEFIVPPAAPSHDEVEAFVLKGRRALEGANARHILLTTQRLWSKLLATQPDSEPLPKVGRLLVETYYGLERQPEGLRIVAQMERLARQRVEPSSIACSLWLQAIGRRCLPMVSYETVETDFGRFREFLDDWQPRSARERADHQTWQFTWARDWLLAGWDNHRSHSSEQTRQGLARRLAVFEQFAERLEAKDEVAVAREIQARAFALLGMFDESWAAWESARGQAGCDWPIQALKIELTEARILLAEGSPGEAWDRTVKVMERAEALGIFHYRQEAVRLLAAIDGSPRPTGDFFE